MKILEYIYYFIGFLLANLIITTVTNGFDLAGSVVNTIIFFAVFIFLMIFWNVFVKKWIKKSVNEDES